VQKFPFPEVAQASEKMILFKLFYKFSERKIRKMNPCSFQLNTIFQLSKLKTFEKWAKK